jgi:cell division protease FtsH
VSDVTAHAIDEEIRKIIDTNFHRAETILKENMDKLQVMAATLIKYETIDEKQISDIMAGREPRPPAEWDDSGPSSKGEDAATPASAESGIGGPASQH